MKHLNRGVNMLVEDLLLQRFKKKLQEEIMLRDKE
jgi:hypothetical protein